MIRLSPLQRTELPQFEGLAAAKPWGFELPFLHFTRRSFNAPSRLQALRRSLRLRRGHDFLKLRTSEADTVRCGQRHFEAIQVPFAVVRLGRRNLNQGPDRMIPAIRPAFAFSAR